MMMTRMAKKSDIGGDIAFGIIVLSPGEVSPKRGAKPLQATFTWKPAPAGYQKLSIFSMIFSTPSYIDFDSILTPNLEPKSHQNPGKIHPKSDLENN